MSVSIVMIGRNESACVESSLRAASASLARAGGGELLFVDAGSTDDTAERAAQVAGVRVVRLCNAPFHAAVARNRGLAASTGEWIQFVDADMELDELWVERAARFLRRHPQTSAVDGQLRERSLDRHLLDATFGLDWPAGAGRVERLGGAAMWRRTAFLVLGGFNESLEVGEDPDLALRATKKGLGLWRLPVPMATHELALTGLVHWWRRAMSVGRSRATVAVHHRAARAAAWRPVLEALMLAVLVAASYVSPWCLVPVGLVLARRLVRSLRRDRAAGHSWRVAWIHGLHLSAVHIPVATGIVLDLVQNGCCSRRLAA